MEVLNLIRLVLGWVFPYISRIHTAYTGEDSSILGTWKVWWRYPSFKLNPKFWSFEGLMAKGCFLDPMLEITMLEKKKDGSKTLPTTVFIIKKKGSILWCILYSCIMSIILLYYVYSCITPVLALKDMGSAMLLKSTVTRSKYEVVWAEFKTELSSFFWPLDRGLEACSNSQWPA